MCWFSSIKIMVILWLSRFVLVTEVYYCGCASFDFSLSPENATNVGVQVLRYGNGGIANR